MSPDAQFNDPLRNWTADSTETVHYFSIYATPPRIGRNTEVRFSYDFSHANGDYLYTIPAGSPIPTPNQLPDVFNKLQQLHIDARYRMTKNLAGTFSYLYEPLKIYDFAFDPSVVNGIVQPSSLVLGLHLSSVHRALGPVRHSLSLVDRCQFPTRPTPNSHKLQTSKSVPWRWLCEDCRVDESVSTHGGLHAQDVRDHRWSVRVRSRRFRGNRLRPGRRGQEGAGGVRGAEVFGLPLDCRKGQQDEPARRRRDEAVGR